MVAFGQRIVIVLLMVALALTLEFLQLFVVGRDVFLNDALASLLGVGLAVILRILAIQCRRRWFDPNKALSRVG